MAKFNLLLVLVLFSITQVLGQKTIYTNTESYNLPLANDGEYNTTVINLISKIKKRPYQSGDFMVNVQIKRSLDEISFHNFNEKTYIQNVTMPGFIYSSFKIPKNACPDLISMKMSLKKNNKEINTLQVVNSSIAKGTQTIKSLKDPSTAPENVNNPPKYELGINNITLSFSKTASQNFMDWVQMVDVYNERNSSTNKKIAEVNTIPSDINVLSNMTNIEKIYKYQKIAQSNLNYINETRSANFWYKLNINSNDPKNLNSNLNTLQNKSLLLNNSCEQVIATLDQVYYKRGQEAYLRKDYTNATFNLNKAVEINPQMWDAKYLLAEIAMRKENYEEAEKNITDILNNVKITNQLVINTTNLANNLVGKYVEFGKYNNQQKNYDEAIQWLIKASKICNSYANVICSTQLKDEFSIAYNAKLDIYLTKVDNNLKSNKFELAEKNLTEAINFQKMHKDYLTDISKIKQRSQNIYNAYISASDNYLARKDYNNAVAMIDKAKLFCSSSEYISCPNDLNQKVTNVYQTQYYNQVDSAQFFYNIKNYDMAEKKLLEADNILKTYSLKKSTSYDKLFKNVKQKLYNTAIEEGLNSYKLKQYQQALDYYKKAVDIESNYSVYKNSKLSSYTKNAAKYLILEKLEQGEVYVTQNNLTAARAINKEAGEISQKYGLSNDYQVKKAFDALKTKIFSQECKNFQAEYDSYYSMAQQKITEQNFIEANNLLLRSIAISKTNTDCEINFSTAQEKIEDIADAVTYQTMLKKANSLSSFDQATQDYIKSYDYFINKNIQVRFGINAQPFEKWVMTKPDDYVFWSIGYLIGDEKIEEAFDLLKVLRTRNFKAKLTKNYQSLLGAKLAQKDFKKNIYTIAKVEVLKYTNNDKWYKYFKKAYIKTGKSYK